ncbi:MAG: class I SAM-dependent methyltransferase, partial [Clostridia bacterium]|nr:class I SAM-dependent methyltransferase [Clostridia bacterium]
MERIERLCTFLDNCRVFADVACDHGYCAEYMLKNELCESAVVSDISEKSLAKAQKLLLSYIDREKCRAVCCDGLEKIDGADEVLIAGIGGAEIIKILQNAYIPEKFIFQPMKNAKALREYLLQN